MGPIPAPDAEAELVGEWMAAAGAAAAAAEPPPPAVVAVAAGVVLLEPERLSLSASLSAAVATSSPVVAATVETRNPASEWEATCQCVCCRVGGGWLSKQCGAKQAHLC